VEREQQMSICKYLTPDYRVIKAKPAPSTPSIAYWCHTNTLVLDIGMGHRPCHFLHICYR